MGRRKAGKRFQAEGLVTVEDEEMRTGVERTVGIDNWMEGL